MNAFGAILSKIKVTWPQALWYLKGQSDNWEGYYITNRQERVECGDAGQRDEYVPGGMERDGMRFHDVSQNDVQFITRELFISGIFHLIILDRG